MRKNYFVNLFITVFFMAVGSFILVAQADFQYPIAELGNCQDEASCRAYCDEPENTPACLDFAKKNNLMSEEEVAMAEKFVDAGSVGPGGCTGKDECENYCNDISHINECIAFAEENDLMPPDELAEAKKVQAALSRGVKPPAGCNSKASCDSYCEEPENMEECITFAQEAGFLEGKELEDAQKMMQAIKRGVKPPPCAGKDQCEEYCSSPDNMEVCMNFALEAGFMSEEEKEGAQKMLEALKKGVKPLPCKGKGGCDAYCGTEEHFEECMNFALAAGFMSEEDAVMARKTGGKGPGGCKGKEECESFCNNPDNQETCFNFAKDNGLMPEEDLRQMEEGKRQMSDSLNQAPPEVMDCINSQLGPELVEKLRNGTAMPSREIGDAMQTCFQQMMPQGGQVPGQGGPGEGMMPPQAGPGGCQTPEECQAYCQANPEACQQFGPPSESGFPQGGFPGQGFPEGQLPEGVPFQEGMPPGNFGPEGMPKEFEQFQPPEGMMPEGEGQYFGSPAEGQQFGPPEGGFQQPPSSEQMQQIQQEMQQQIQQQIQQQMQQPPSEMMAPPPQETPPPPPTTETPPQSLLDKTQNFLGSIISIITGR